MSWCRLQSLSELSLPSLPIERNSIVHLQLAMVGGFQKNKLYVIMLLYYFSPLERIMTVSLTLPQTKQTFQMVFGSEHCFWMSELHKAPLKDCGTNNRHLSDNCTMLMTIWGVTRSLATRARRLKTWQNFSSRWKTWWETWWGWNWYSLAPTTFKLCVATFWFSSGNRKCQKHDNAMQIQIHIQKFVLFSQIHIQSIHSLNWLVKAREVSRRNKKVGKKRR